MVDAKTFTANVMKETNLQERIKLCAQSKCEPLRNVALAQLNKGNPLQHTEGTTPHLESQLVSVDAAESATQANMCVEKCREPLELVQLVLKENWNRMARNNGLCLQGCRQFQKGESESASVEDMVESELSLDKCRAQCR